LLHVDICVQTLASCLLPVQPFGDCQIPDVILLTAAAAAAAAGWMFTWVSSLACAQCMVHFIIPH